MDNKGTFLSVFKTFLKLGVTSFGGPIAHLGYFRKEIVERQKWISENQFGQLLAICQFLPGPASSQLGFVLGLLRAGWLGAIAAFIAFTTPSAILLILFASMLPYLSSGLGISAIHGLKLVACAVVADAVFGMTKKLCPDVQRKSICLLAVCVLILAGSTWAQILVVIAGGTLGFILCKDIANAEPSQISVNYGSKTGGTLLVLFFVLLIGLGIFASPTGISAVANAFYKAGALVFGGGHVVLPLLEETIVGLGWVSEENFLAGYGASQAIPGPMFAFSAYLGTIIPTNLGPWFTAIFALFFMFLPGFLLVSAALPLWQRISSIPNAGKAIAGVNAAVVGLLIAAFYDPIFKSGIQTSTDLIVAIVGFGMLAIWKLSPLYVVLWCVAANMGLQFI